MEPDCRYDQIGAGVRIKVWCRTMADTPEKIKTELTELESSKDGDFTVSLSAENADDSKTVITRGPNLEGTQVDNSVLPGSAKTLFAGKYLILEKIGSGGISTVYKVRHSVLDRLYALKLLQEVKQDSLLRFQQEAKAATLLNHPNIVGVVDFGVSDGIPYMVMDFVDGVTLGKYTRDKKQNTEGLSRVFGEVCLALAHAHEKGVIHRDIKPGNIMITTDSENVDHAVVVDFGIAKIIGEPSNTNPNLTRTGDVFGTPLYMSPEQCQGSSIVDARSDIYSLACVMYEVIAGKPPFEGDSAYQIIHQHMSKAPPPFSNELRKSKGIGKLEAIILKAMAKDPSDRYQYMLEMSSALKAVELALGQTGMDPLFRFKLALTRLKASDKETAILKIGLQMSALLSFIIVLILFTFPPKIKDAEKTIDREMHIISVAKGLFANITAQDQSIFHLRPSLKRKMLNELTDLCKYDPQVARYCKRVVSSTRKAIEMHLGLTKYKEQLIEGGLGIDLLSGVNKMEWQISRTVALWSQSNAEQIDLVNLVSGKVEAHKGNLVVMKSIFYLSLALAFPLGIVLCVLIRLRLRWYRNQKEAQKPGNSVPAKLT